MARKKHPEDDDGEIRIGDRVRYRTHRFAAPEPEIYVVGNIWSTTNHRKLASLRGKQGPVSLSALVLVQRGE